MGIVSVMLPEELASALDKVASKCGYTSRSEAIRHAIRSFIADMGVEEAGGFTTAVMVVVYARGKARVSLKVQHEFMDIIHTLIHAHMDGGACVDVLVLRGSPGRIREFASKLRARNGVQYVRFMTIPPA